MEKRIGCEYCPSDFKTKASLQSHCYKYHDDVYNYQYRMSNKKKRNAVEETDDDNVVYVKKKATTSDQHVTVPVASHTVADNKVEEFKPGDSFLSLREFGQNKRKFDLNVKAIDLDCDNLVCEFQRQVQSFKEGLTQVEMPVDQCNSMVHKFVVKKLGSYKEEEIHRILNYCKYRWDAESGFIAHIRHAHDTVFTQCDTQFNLRSNAKPIHVQMMAELELVDDHVTLNREVMIAEIYFLKAYHKMMLTSPTAISQREKDEQVRAAFASLQDERVHGTSN